MLAVSRKRINWSVKEQIERGCVNYCDGNYGKQFIDTIQDQLLIHENKSSFMKACYYENIPLLKWISVFKI